LIDHMTPETSSSLMCSIDVLEDQKNVICTPTEYLNSCCSNRAVPYDEIPLCAWLGYKYVRQMDSIIYLTQILNLYLDTLYVKTHHVGLPQIIFDIRIRIPSMYNLTGESARSSPLVFVK